MSIYDQLVRVAPDGISLVPGLAESWDISEDGLTYTFHLRPNVALLRRHADDVGGRPLLLGPRRQRSRAALDLHPHRPEAGCRGQVEGITAPDDATVVVELAQPWAPFLSDVAMFNMSVISKAFAEGNEERLATSAWGPVPSRLASGARASP